MRKLVLFLAVFLSLTLPVASQTALPTVQISGTLYAQNSSVELATLTGQSTCTIRVSGLFSGTISFLATTSFATPFVPLQVQQVVNGVPTGPSVT